MQRTAFICGILFAALAVILGAFGAHALKARLAAEQLQVFETAVRYQMYHAFALLLLGISFDKLNTQLASAGAWLFLAGIVFFSGSLYLLAFKPVAGIDPGLTAGQVWKFLGPVTPLGGLCFICGWIAFLLSYLKK